MRPLVQRLLFNLVLASIPVNSWALELPPGASAPDQARLTALLSGNTLDGLWAGPPSANISRHPDRRSTAKVTARQAQAPGELAAMDAFVQCGPHPRVKPATRYWYRESKSSGNRAASFTRQS